MVSLLLLWHVVALLSIKYTLFNVLQYARPRYFLFLLLLLVVVVVFIVVCLLLLLLVLHLIWPSFSPSYASRNIKDMENVGQTIFCLSNIFHLFSVLIAMDCIITRVNYYDKDKINLDLNDL